uniref:Uncharacterized protein LOC102807032 n=1 Tax=Saccoglossus kowalevskii TaxID=10224 RepID=A0ABM0MG12_SACKO|nr:PREDICTED: uncharacterized protein LOC102807032 [Saccoglossus kowalevskii]
MVTRCLEFIEFHKTLDDVLKKIDERGIGSQKRQAASYTDDDEDKLWQKIFSPDTTTSLRYAAYFYVCKIFALRAVDEHSNHAVEQFVKGTDKDGEYIEFRGRPCKNNQGGLYNARKMPYKDVRQYSNPKNPRCVIKFVNQVLELSTPSGPKPTPLGQQGWDIEIF